MRITNKHNLPSVFEEFEKAAPYDAGRSDFTVTQLIDSPRVVQLRRRHSDELEEDISERIFAILGSTLHHLLETAAKRIGAISEERIFTQVNDELVVSGAIDLQEPIEGGVRISDYKMTSMMTLIFNPDGKAEWENQLNLYAELVEREKLQEVKELEVIAVLRDWSASAVERNANAPKLPVVRLRIPLWDKEKRSTYLQDQVDRHLASSQVNDVYLSSLVHCSPEEMWERPAKYAFHRITKAGTLSKVATRVFDNQMEADLLAQEQEGEVIVRPGTRTRCEGDYCKVSKWCEQYEEWRTQDEG